MKRKMKKKLIAFMLCMVLVICNSVSILADTPAAATTTAENQVSETKTAKSEKSSEENKSTDDNDTSKQSEETDETKDEAPETKTTEQKEETTEATTEEKEDATTATTEAEEPTTEATTEDKATTEAADETSETDEKKETTTAEEEKTTAAEEETANQDNEIEEITKYEYKGDDVNVTVTLTNPEDLPDDAELVVTPVTLSQEVKDEISDESIKRKVAIENIFAYDIKFVQNGVEVQPGSTVKVYISKPEIQTDQTASVYHVDDNDNLENMNGQVDENGDVVFDTTHFSTYVIVQQGGEAVNITIEHYDNTKNPAEKIYADDKIQLPVGGMINDYTKALNWNVSKVVVGDNEYTQEQEYQKIEVSQDTTIKVYYIPKKTTIDGAVRFYDYTVKAGSVTTGWFPWEQQTTYYSINQESSYNGDTRDRLSAGTTSQNYDEYQYSVDVGNYKANNYTGSSAVVKGLLKGLDSDGNVVFNYADPGFFVNEDLTVTVGTGYQEEERYLRQYYDNYKIFFDRTGDTYEFTEVKDGNQTLKYGKAGSNFFPLDEEKKNYEESDDGHNFFFGMRYDVKFTIGDYVGPLNYSFTGDDDLWVVLDGDKVVIDLGGIHSAATDEVDLWESLNLTPGTLTDEQKKEEHTLTILYMERGASASNCQMEFTLPSARISEVTNVPMTNLMLHKVNSENEVLEGARFTLENNSTGEKMSATSGEDGVVNFTSLREGEYTLTEAAAPSGYIPAVNSWIVKVVPNDDGGVDAHLYSTDGETEAKVDPDANGIYKILNITEEELINSSMNYDKEVQVNNWDDRTYDITISASSKLTSSTTTEKGGVVDAMMVFDMSGSMNYRMSGKESVPEAVLVGSYNNIKENLDTEKVYYYGYEWGYANTSRHSYMNRPMIYLNDQWQYYSNGSWHNIKDNSTQYIYTFDSRLTNLKEAATTFVTSTSVSSPESYIGVATYSNRNGRLVSALNEIGNNPEELIKAINGLFADGGTYMEEGLEKAFAELVCNDYKVSQSGYGWKIELNGEQRVRLDSKGDPIPQYIIVLSDGKDSDEPGAERWARWLKEYGVKIYTIGLGVDTSTANWLKNNIATAPEYALTTDTESLGEIFQKIQETITQSLDISGAQIKDVIDPRFEIVDSNGKPVADGTEINGGTVYTDPTTGYQYIVWTEQTIPAEGEWNQTFTVKAKDEYIGGNNVTTNISPDSEISTGYGDAILPQPTVNVKADFIVENNEITIFKGETVPTGDELTKLFDVAKPKRIVKTTNGSETTYEVVECTIGNTLDNGEYVINDDDFDLTWYGPSTNSGDMEDSDFIANYETDPTEMSTDVPEVDPTYYYLQVTFNPGSPTSGEGGSTENTDENIAGVSDGEEGYIVTATNVDDIAKDDTEKRPYGVYTIHLQTGTINIIKKSGSVDGDGLANAVFKIEKWIPSSDSQGEGSWETVIESGTNGQITTVEDGTASFTNLGIGTYRITEIQAPEGHSLLANPIIVEEFPYPKASISSGGSVSVDEDAQTVEIGEKECYPTITYTIVNNELFEMPEAGGRNIFMMTLAGTAMIALAAGSTIYYRRRRGAHNKTRR